MTDQELNQILIDFVTPLLCIVTHSLYKLFFIIFKCNLLIINVSIKTNFIFFFTFNNPRLRLNHACTNLCLLWKLHAFSICTFKLDSFEYLHNPLEYLRNYGIYISTSYDSYNVANLEFAVEIFKNNK